MSDETPEQEQEETKQVKVLQVQLPDSAELVTAAVTVVTYLTADGSEKYAIHTKGEAPIPTLLGLLARASHEMNKRWDE